MEKMTVHLHFFDIYCNKFTTYFYRLLLTMHKLST